MQSTATPAPAAAITTGARAPLSTRGVDYVFYSVSDLDRSVAFYRDVLGLPFDYIYEGWWAEFNVQPVSVALCGPPAGTAPQPGDRGGATVALAVPDVREAVEDLRERGVIIVAEPLETPVCFIATVADPDGNRITLHQRKDGTAG
jgi:predicted enzyme related to lactoylglutathione lyase